MSNYPLDNTKEKFLNTWPGGYKENWAVYGKASGKSEQEVVDKCLSPFFNREKICLEIGCGKAFWTDGYLANNFKQVIALDLLPNVKFRHTNITYIEVPDRDFSCYGVVDNSVDFCWSFGVFCHLSLQACQAYVNAIYDKLKDGGEVALYFSNEDRRPLPEGHSFHPNHVQWVRNNFTTTTKMLENAGFVDIKDLMPDLMDTMIYGRKQLSPLDF
jgi:hypothetical protein